MAAIVANKVKRERQLRESKASIDTSIQQLHQRGSCKGRESDQDNLQLQTKMMYYKQIDNSEFPDGLYQDQGSSSLNVVLYLGLGMMSVGMVITVVGIGDKGFRTLELKLIGPSLICFGIFFALIRILLCTVPICWNSFRKTSKKDNIRDLRIYGSQTSIKINQVATGKNFVENSFSDFEDDHQIEQSPSGKLKDMVNHDIQSDSTDVGSICVNSDGREIVLGALRLQMETEI